MNYEIKPIGVIHSPIKKTDDMPIEGVRAEIHISEEYEQALEGVENYSHLILLCFSHQAERTRLKITPKKFFSSAEEKGVFATRTPSRPNPITLDVVKLVKRDTTTLTVDNMDMIDGTPVIDIKPYANEMDCVFSAKKKKWVTAQMTDENMLKMMVRDVVNFHGELCVGGAIGARVAFLATKKLGGSLKERDVKILANSRACIADAVQGIASATNKRFRMGKHDERVVTFFKGTRQLRVVVTTKKKYVSIDEVLGASDAELFDVVEETQLEKPMEFRR